MKRSTTLFLVLSFLFSTAVLAQNGSREAKVYPDQPQPVVAPTDNAVVYSDDMDGANDTTALKARGYLVYYRGTGPQGLTATWFQGNSSVFSAYNGPADGYVAANYNAVTGLNNIDNWLVFPELDLMADDTLYFWERSPASSIYPDSIRVMYSQSSTTPEGVWTELGKFKTTTTGSWNMRSFVLPFSSPIARLAIRYCVVNGGPSGSNSDFIGLDAISVVREAVIPVELTSFTAAVVQKGVELNWTTATETNNFGFEVQRAASGSQFEKIGFVPGCGTTTELKSYTFTDENITLDKYTYRLVQIDLDGTRNTLGTTETEVAFAPQKYALLQNYPNPFNPSTTISYQLPEKSQVTLSIYDMLGNLVTTLVNSEQNAGSYEVNFDASGYSSGIYYYSITAGSFNASKKLILMK